VPCAPSLKIAESIGAFPPSMAGDTMKSLCTTLILLAANAAFAETTISTPVSGAWTLKRGYTTVASASGPLSDCRARAAVDAESRVASASYVCAQQESLTVTYTAAPVQCAPTQPANDTQQASCPAGGSGSFTQTRSYALQATPTCWVASTWSPATAPTGACSTITAAGSHTTSFDSTENPVSEGGKWYRANNAWTNVRTANGFAYGTNGITNSYDDAYALLAGSFGPDQTIEAVIYRDPSLPSGAVNEVELLMRMSDDSGNVRGYEALFNASGNFDIVRWNGPFGSFTNLPLSQSGYWGRPLVSGDVVKATIIGNVITTYINGVLMAKATDSTFKTGQPGMGFFIRPGYGQAGLGLTSYTVTSK
jgi:hypothetical protein